MFCCVPHQGACSQTLSDRSVVCKDGMLLAFQQLPPPEVAKLNVTERLRIKDGRGSWRGSHASLPYVRLAGPFLLVLPSDYVPTGADYSLGRGHRWELLRCSRRSSYVPESCIATVAQCTPPKKVHTPKMLEMRGADFCA